MRWHHMLVVTTVLFATVLTNSSALRSSTASAAEPERVLLWPEGAPGAVGKEEIDQPSITVYPAPADKANGFAMLICPGGGYQHLAVDHEGK